MQRDRAVAEPEGSHAHTGIVGDFQNTGAIAVPEGSHARR